MAYKKKIKKTKKTILISALLMLNLHLIIRWFLLLPWMAMFLWLVVPASLGLKDLVKVLLLQHRQIGSYFS